MGTFYVKPFCGLIIYSGMTIFINEIPLRPNRRRFTRFAAGVDVLTVQSHPDPNACKMSGNLGQALLAHFAVGSHSRAGRNEASHDDIFFEPEQIVHLAGRCGIRQYLGRFLKRCRGNETLSA